MSDDAFPTYTEAEVFADRAYLTDGTLVPRSRPGSVITDESEVVSRAVRMATERTASTVEGNTIRLEAETLCVHGDTPGAARLARAIRLALERAGVTVQSLRDTKP